MRISRFIGVLGVALAWISTARALEQVQVIGAVRISTQSSVSVSPATGSTTTVQGMAAHDAAVSGNPLLMGVYASTNANTAVQQGDVTRAWANLEGRLIVMTGSPYDLAVSSNITASGASVLISSPSASTSLYICKGSVHNAGASNVTLSLKDGVSGATFWRAELASEGGGSLFDFGGACKKLSANTLLVGSLSGAGDVDVNITEYFTGP